MLGSVLSILYPGSGLALLSILGMTLPMSFSQVRSQAPWLQGRAGFMWSACDPRAQFKTAQVAAVSQNKLPAPL